VAISYASLVERRISISAFQQQCRKKSPVSVGGRAHAAA
jgi:hypothetical protein